MTKDSNCPWCQTGASTPITGCRFTLAPMSDDYISIILGSISKIDTSMIYSLTDKTSTIYRGSTNHVIDCVKACFMHAYRSNIHMTSELTFSQG